MGSFLDAVSVPGLVQSSRHDLFLSVTCSFACTCNTSSMKSEFYYFLTVTDIYRQEFVV